MLTDADIQLHADKIRDDGYTVIERAADAALVDGLKEALERTEREHGLGYAKTSFEGFKTVRINNLLTYDELFWEVPLHENVLPVVERVLDKECSSQQDKLYGAQAGPNTWNSPPGDVSIPLGSEIRNCAELLAFGWHLPIYRQVAGKA